MTDVKHTPGPLTYGEDTREVYGPNGNPLCEIYDTAEALEGDDPEADANGYLFAAAPDLLSACKTALEALTSGDKTMWEHPESPYHNIGAAIAKATGGAP